MGLLAADSRLQCCQVCRRRSSGRLPAHRDWAEGVLVGVHDVWVAQVGGQHSLKDAVLACSAMQAVRVGGWGWGLVG